MARSAIEGAGARGGGAAGPGGLRLIIPDTGTAGIRLAEGPDAQNFSKSLFFRSSIS